MTPALTSSSLNLPISVRSFSSGMTPASESLVALTIIMKRMAISFQVNELDTQEDLLHSYWSNGRMPIRQGAENSFPVPVKPERQEAGSRKSTAQVIFLSARRGAARGSAARAP